MAIASPIDVVTPAVRRRQQLANQLQQQYATNRGGQKQLQALNGQALHAMPLFAGNGVRDSATLPAAPMPQLTFPFMQSPGVMQGLGVANPASPQSPTSSQSPGQGAPGFPDPAQQGMDLGVTQSTAPATPQQNSPQAGQGLYADGSPQAAPLMNQQALLQTFAQLPSIRRLFGDQPLQSYPTIGGGTNMRLA